MLFMFFIVLFTAFLTARNIFKTCCRFLCAGIVAVTRTVAAKPVALVPIFIYAVFIESTTLAVETLARLSLTILIESTALTVETQALTLAWLPS